MIKEKSQSSSIERAEAKDYEDVKALFDHANDYSVTKDSVPIWVNIDYAYKQLWSDVEAGNCFVVRTSSGKIAASICITEEDSFTWGDEGADGQALYFHKLMKDPAIAPPGVGKELVAFAASQVLTRGKKYLRCDTRLGTTSLVGYYRRLGFNQKRVIVYPSTKLEAVLLEADPHSLI